MMSTYFNGDSALFWLLCLQFLGWEVAHGRVCPGFCVPPDLCASDGGVIVGYCVNQRACCDVSQSKRKRGNDTIFKYGPSCGEKVRWDGIQNPSGNKPVRFSSPDYPAYSRGSLICSLEINLDKNTVGIRLDLEVFELDKKIHVHGSGGGGAIGSGFDSGGGASLGFGEDENFKCDADMFFIKGFSDWMTDPKCGVLNGFSLLMDIDKVDHPDKKVILLFIMSSKRYRWKIKINQITPKKLQKSELCLKTRTAIWLKSSSKNKDIPQENISSNLHLSPNSKGPSNKSQTPALEFKFPWNWHAHVVSIVQDSNFAARGNQEILCQSRQGQGNNTRSLPPEFSLSKMCSGSIIDDRHILTTASCFLQSRSNNKNAQSTFDLEIQNLKLITSSFCENQGSVKASNGIQTDNSKFPLGKDFYDIESITIHFNYVSSFLTNDVAIVRTKDIIHFHFQGNDLNSNFPRENSNQGIFIVQPISFDTEFYHPNNKRQQSFLFTESSAIFPEEKHDCIETQALNLHLTPAALNDLQESNKYKGITSNFLCFKMHPFTNTSVNSKQDQLIKTASKSSGLRGQGNEARNLNPEVHEEYFRTEAQTYKWLAGSSLISGPASAQKEGEIKGRVKLEGIFSHVYYKQLEVMSNYSVDFQFQPPWPWYFSFTRFTNLSYIGSSRAKATAFAYFTSIEYFRNWILMAIS